MIGRIQRMEDILLLAEEAGFLPFFACGTGVSVEELCAPALWFTEEEGPWEWKGPIARTGRCAYGKFFGGKAGFVSRAWLPDFCNFRRDGYDFDARCDEGLAPHQDAYVYQTVADAGELLSKRLKQLCGFKKDQNTGFDTIVTRLQMQTYLCIADFIYERDRHGKPYGWGVALYSTPEAQFGCELVSSAYRRPPEESRTRIEAHLRTVCGLSKEQADRLIGLLKH